MLNKNTVILLLCLLTVTFQCSRNCNTCPTPTTCTACAAGNFVVNGSSCAPCPIGCTTCAPGDDGRPVCSECAPPGQLGDDGRCFLCDPMCAQCSGNPRNCTECPPGKELRMNDTQGSCGAMTDCPIQKCAECAPPDEQNNTFCGRCLPGFFPYMQFCVPCKFPCGACDYNPDILWPQLAQILTAGFGPALEAAHITDLTPYPFLNNLDFDNMPDIFKRGWIQAYFILKLAPNPELVIATLPQQLTYFVSIQALAWPQQQLAILRRINSVYNKTWTLQDLYNKTAQVATTFTMCAECLNGFQRNANGTDCERCSPNCLQCDASVCSVCNNGYFLDGSTCSPCTAPCRSCGASATECTTCLPPFSLSGSTCIQCEGSCATCSDSNTSACITCKRPYSLTADSGNCFRCDQDLCIDCDPTNTTICFECRFGATLVDGRCQLCPANCSSCSAGTPPTCFECLSGYQLATLANGDTRCLPCGPRCRRCTNQSCLQCQPGTFLNPDTGRCQRCRQGCKECTSLEACTLPENGIVIINGNAITCVRGCKTCEGSPNACTECQQRYFSDSGICRPCEPGCKVCNDRTTCTQCLENLNLVGNDCVRCEGNCKTCDSSNATSCLTCKRGFTLIGDDCVHQCSRGCLECDATNSSICLTCVAGASLRPDGRCVRCLGSCSGTCDPRNISICLTCADGFELKNNKCVRCPLGCTSCQNGDCSDCAPGFKMSQRTNGSFYCAERCRPPCATCSGQTCRVCETGFKLVSGRCVPDLSCNPTCQFCPPGTERNDNGTCIPCPSNCASCLSATCLECQEGFYLDGATCVRCPANCSSCFNADSCGLCARGYVKQIISMGEGLSDATFSDRCIRCDSSCSSCVAEPDRCTSCPDGTRLLNSKCVGMFTVSSTLEVDIPYATFLENSESEQLTTAIARQCGVSTSNVIINEVREGSTVVRSTVATNSQTQASNAQQSLTTVSGYTILGSSATVYYGDQMYVPPEQPTTEKPANIGLIVGVVVGGVVLIAVVSFLIYKFKCKKTVPVSMEDQSAIVTKQ